MSGPHPFEARLHQNWPPSRWQDAIQLLAVSGGVDSVALLSAMARIGCHGPGKLVVAHFNHRLRPEADEDERFVCELAGSLRLQFISGASDVAQQAGAEGDGLEAAARAARYEFLQTAAEKLGGRYVATAHTADDQAETILHHVIRGTGLNGLAGIPEARALGPTTTLVRPLLPFRRAELETYLQEIGQPHRDDRSNLDTAFTRNRIRLELLPLITRDYHPGAVDSLLRLGRLAGASQAVVDARVAELFGRAVSPLRGGAAVDIRLLQHEPPYLVCELLIAVWRNQNWPRQAMGSEQWERLAGMIQSEQDGSPAPSKRTLPGSITAEVAGEQLLLRMTDPANASTNHTA